MKTHIILPTEGVRMFNQSHASAIREASEMHDSLDGQRTLILARAGIRKDELIADLNQAIEYARKDLL